MADSAMQVDLPIAVASSDAAPSAKRRKLSSSSRAGTVLEELQSVHDDLRTAFPLAHTADAAARLNGLSTSQAVAGSTNRNASMAERIRRARQGLLAFRDVWQSERSAVASGADGLLASAQNLANGSLGAPTQDPDAELERRRATLLRVMLDLSNNRTNYLHLRHSLDGLLAHVERQTLAPDHSLPFPHPTVLSSPTDRLIAFGQHLGLDVSVDNDNPDYGMGNFGAGASEGEDGSGRMDTLAFAARTVLLEVQIQQQTVASTMAASRTSQHASQPSATHNLIKLRASHYPNMEEEGVFLPEPTSRLMADFQEYLDIVNRVQSTASAASTETLPLRAERAFMRFARNLQQVVELDKLEANSDGEDVKSSGAHRFDDLEAIRAHLSSLAERGELQALEPAEILPHFRLADRIAAPRFSIRSRNTKQLGPFSSDPHNQGDSDFLRPGWYVELSEDVVVGQDTFSAPALGTSIHKKLYIRPSSKLESVLLDRPGQSSLASEVTLANGSTLVFQAGSTSRSALLCKELPFGSLRQLDEIIQGLQRELALQSLFKSCFTERGLEAATQRYLRSEADVDEELDGFMRGESDPHLTRPSSIRVKLLADKLCIDLPAGFLPNTTTATSISIAFKAPDRFEVIADDPEAPDLALTESLRAADHHLPSWLDAMRTRMS